MMFIHCDGHLDVAPRVWGFAMMNVIREGVAKPLEANEGGDGETLRSVAPLSGLWGGVATGFFEHEISHALSASPDILVSSILVGALLFLRRKIEQIYQKKIHLCWLSVAEFWSGGHPERAIWERASLTTYCVKWNCHETLQFVPQPCFALSFEDWQGLTVALCATLRIFQ